MKLFATLLIAVISLIEIEAGASLFGAFPDTR